MKFVVDLHLHSKYSRAVSSAMNLSNMQLWAKYKGINVLGTGDFTHPFWLDQLKNELEDAGNGLFRLKRPISGDYKGGSEIFFMLSSEISSIYSQGGKVRRIHNLFFFPKISSVEKFNRELLRRKCNLRSDGRPIVGVPSNDLAKIAFECDERVMVIPAHIWTPWFSVFGSFSGFDSLEECFGRASKNIFAVESGLSSDPAMNWRVQDLDNRSIVSFSDSHSLEKMGREATVIEAGEISYESIYYALKNSAKLGEIRKLEQSELRKARTSEESDYQSYRKSEYSDSCIAFTVEFHPEEGKYHFTGHRNCKVSLSPDESKEKRNICPVCQKGLTVGVMSRVDDLGRGYLSQFEDETKGLRWVKSKDGRPPFVNLVPLLEIIAEALDFGVSTKKVRDQYFSLVDNLRSELSVLMTVDLLEIARLAPGRVVEGIEKVRSGKIVVEPGYDGEYGVVKIWNEGEKKGMEELRPESESQLNLFV